MHSAEIVEIFSSPQGEGLYVGERMTFVRFGRCNLRCNFCDTPQGLCYKESCRVEVSPGAAQFAEVANPIGVTKLCELMHGFNDEIISVTGGEPLEQADFLAQWLPSQSVSHKILLETNGINHEKLDLVLPFVNIVSMDIKLPSSSGERALWKEHSIFLSKAIASGRETYVKIVVTANTTDDDIQRAIDILTHANKYIPVIIQPASPTLKFYDPASKEKLESAFRLCHAYLPDVRIVPQMHKVWGVL